MCKHVGEPCLRINVVQTGGRKLNEYDCRMVSAALGAGRCPVAAPQGHHMFTLWPEGVAPWVVGVPMGVDVCYTNHAEADQDDMDNLMVLLTVAGVNFLIAVPGADDVMLNYQSLSYHDIVGLRHQFNRPPAPEFEAWLQRMGMLDHLGRLAPASASGQFSRNLLSYGVSA